MKQRSNQQGAERLPFTFCYNQVMVIYYPKKRKNKVKTYLIIFTIFLLGILIPKIISETKDSISLPVVNPKIDRYYAAVTYLSDSRTNVAKSQLTESAKTGKLIVLEKDKGDLTGFLGVDLINTAAKSEDIKLDTDKLVILRASDLTPNFKVLSIDGKSLFSDTDYPLFARVTKEEGEEKFDPSKVIKMTSVGDIILGRSVYEKMLSLGYMSPFSNVSERLKAADITFGDLETPLSNKVTPPTEGMSFLAPQAAIVGILASGFNILGLANNHSTNFGAETFTDTLNLLKKEKIEYVGGGENLAEARQYKILNIKNKKFAFLDVNSIIGDLEAGPDSPGDWHITLKPWGNLNQTQVDELLAQVRKARQESDYLTVMVHWSAEYTHDPNSEMRNLAHQVLDAGADQIIGTHPHWTQGTEVYKGKFIAYSLGNFIFDQEWSAETKQGLIMDSYFYGSKLISVNLTPVLIENYHRPRILDSVEGKPIMDAVWEASEKLK
ncbi:MAG: CapA family protein [Patescibacteria group bacterium]|nr:CapA family protein [Patescibacteria group bacterium]